MKKYIKRSLLISLTLFTMVGSATAENARDEFDFFDQNRNGAITFDEFFVVMMHRQARNFSYEFSEADRDNSKTITFEEAERFEITFGEYEQADKDHSGEVDMEEFISATMNSIFRDADLNHNNTVDYSEFKQVQDGDS